MRAGARGGAILCAAAVATGAAADIKLTDRTAEVGLASTHQPVALGFPGNQEWMTGGVAVADFSGDGWPDVYWISGGGIPDRLFINDQDGTFTERGFEWGLVDLHCGSGAAAGDYDGDGRIDLFVTSYGNASSFGDPGQHRLYRNVDGTHFEEVAAEAGVSTTTTAIAAGFGAAWGDYDLDGDLDLCVTSWWGGQDGNRLFRNDGSGTFTDVTMAALGPGVEDVWGFQPAFVDMNDDLYPELLIAADFESSRYYVNNGDGTFTDMTVPSGTGLDDNGMGQTVADLDLDGRLDWYVTSIHKDTPLPGDNVGNMLYRNLGGHVFEEVSVESGTNDGGWGWGTVAVDLDHDRRVDLVEVNGRPGAGEWQNEPAKLFRNDGEMSFTEIAAVAGLDHADEGRAVVRLDADRDGDQDLIVFTNAGALAYYANETSPSGHWLRISLDTSAHPLLAPNGLGATVRATVDGKAYVTPVYGGPSYLGTSELTAHLGLADAAVVDELAVIWPRGQITRLHDVPADQDLFLAAPAPADLDASGAVGVADLLGLLSRWGPVTDAHDLLADLNGDGIVNVSDLLRLLVEWS